MGEGQAVSEAAEVKIEAPSVVTLRAYLQRAEVRLSTMHRIAGAFLGGAGLLTLRVSRCVRAPRRSSCRYTG